MADLPSIPARDWLPAQPEVTRCFDDWANRVRALDNTYTMRLGAVALMHGFESGQALRDADPATLSPIAIEDRTRLLREHRAATVGEGRLLGRALLALAAQLLPRAGAPPGAAVAVARSLLDAFVARLP